ncbi:hypothetical protein T07_8093 [Trichinella nelsoni]|uniref:Uncharacterized protein n=1 Tax=Trichinella nelsoni TaxID=6336 RepID=A0A0V0RB89_9BILA|nr:hypothetical protein T07_8093 [Trichinella nelsoni]
MKKPRTSVTKCMTLRLPYTDIDRFADSCLILVFLNGN